MTPHQPANHAIARDELVHESFDREQQEAVAVGDCRAVVADRDDGVGRQRQPRGDRGNVALAARPRLARSLPARSIERDGAEHQAAFFGNDRKPVSASAIGG